MNLKKTRSLISLLITLFFSVTLSCALSSLLINFTFASSSFMEKYFVSDKLVRECDVQLNLQFNALSVKSGIPVRVFKNINNEISTDEMLRLSVYNFYNGNDSAAVNNTREKYFFKLCTEYLDGNELKYNEQDIYNTAIEAAEIYNGCLSLHNAEHLADFAENVHSNAPKASLSLLCATMFFGFLFYILYRSKNRAFSYVAAGISVSGVTLVLISAVSLIFKIGTGFVMTPDAYYDALCSVISLFFVLLAAVGILLIIAGSIFNIVIYNKEKKKDRR